MVCFWYYCNISNNKSKFKIGKQIEYTLKQIDLINQMPLENDYLKKLGSEYTKQLQIYLENLYPTKRWKEKKCKKKHV